MRGGVIESLTRLALGLDLSLAESDREVLQSEHDLVCVFHSNTVPTRYFQHFGVIKQYWSARLTRF